MAEALGLNPLDYPNKRSIAEVILRARREQRERERVEKEREAREGEVRKKMSVSTVKGKMAAIKATAEKMQKAVKELQAGIEEQANENRAYVKAFYG